MVVDGLEEVETAIVGKDGGGGVRGALAEIGGDELDAEGTRVVGVCIERLESGVGVVIDGGVKDCAAEFVAVGGNVGAATGQTQPKRRSGADQHNCCSPL